MPAISAAWFFEPGTNSAVNKLQDLDHAGSWRQRRLFPHLKKPNDGHPLHRQLLLPWRQVNFRFVLHVPQAREHPAMWRTSTAGTAACQDGGTWAAASSHVFMGKRALSEPPRLTLSPFPITESGVTSDSHGTDCSGTWEAECRAGSRQPGPQSWGSCSPFCLR